MGKNVQSKSITLFLCLYLCPLAGMGIDIYTPSLPHIVEYFGVHPALVKFTLAAYLIGYGVGQPFFGTVSDSCGRRKPLIFGLLIYIIMSILCSFSPNITTLILFRIIQGSCIGAAGAITKSIISDSFEGKELAAKFTYMNIAWGLGPIVAPGIGGYLQFYLGWEWNFFFLALYSGVGLLMVYFLLKETNQNLVPLHFQEVFNTHREIFSNKVFIAAAIIMSICYGMIILFNIVGLFVIQVVLGKNSIVFGHIAFVMGFAYLLGSITNRFFIRKKDGLKVVPIGLTFSLISSGVMYVLSWMLGVNLYVLTMPIFVCIFGAGLIFPNMMAKAMSLFRHRGGSASALMGALFVFGSGVISFLASFLKTHSLLSISFSYLVLSVIMLIIYYYAIRPRFSNVA